MNWIKTTVSSVYSEKGNCLSSACKCQVEHPGKTADLLHIQAMWDWFHDVQDSHPLNMPVTQIMINAVGGGTLLHEQPK